MINLSGEEILASTGFIISEFRGTSMNPLLRSGRDRVFIEKPTNRLKKGDIALYKRTNGEYVLHRVFKVLDGAYAFWGDNHFEIEYGILDSQILGVAKGFYKGEKYIDFSKSKKYKIYKYLWCTSIFKRRIFNFFRKIYGKIRQIFLK